MLYSLGFFNLIHLLCVFYMFIPRKVLKYIRNAMEKASASSSVIKQCPIRHHAKPLPMYIELTTKPSNHPLITYMTAHFRCYTDLWHLSKSGCRCNQIYSSTTWSPAGCGHKSSNAFSMTSTMNGFMCQNKKSHPQQWQD